MNIYTIGFTKKSAEEFFTLLKKNNVSIVYDIRLNNSNQLAGFSKGKDLKYFLKVINNMEYSHENIFAPTKEILDSYKKKKITWEEYEELYKELLDKRNVYKYIKEKELIKEGICFLCSEQMPTNCHRKLLAEYIKEKYEVDIYHL